jgi:hypothetical protein
MQPIDIDPGPGRLGLSRRFMEAAVPFAPGTPTEQSFSALDVNAAELPLQTRVLGSWPDGTLRWLQVICATGRQNQPVRLVGSRGGPPLPPLIRQTAASVDVDTGSISWSIPLRLGEGRSAHQILEGVRRRARRFPVTGSAPVSGLRVTGHDGRQYWSAWDPQGPRVRIHSCGPLQATVLIESRPTCHTGESLLSSRVRLDVWRHSSIVRLAVGWLNDDQDQAALVRDIRFVLPLGFTADEAVLGCEYGSCPLGPWRGLHAAGRRQPVLGRSQRRRTH